MAADCLPREALNPAGTQGRSSILKLNLGMGIRGRLALANARTGGQLESARKSICGGAVEENGKRHVMVL